MEPVDGNGARNGGRRRGGAAVTGVRIIWIKWRGVRRACAEPGRGRYRVGSSL